MFSVMYEFWVTIGDGLTSFSYDLCDISFNSFKHSKFALPDISTEPQPHHSLLPTSGSSHVL